MKIILWFYLNFSFKGLIGFAPYLLLFLLMKLSSCFTAGTHGSIKAYEYPVPKAVLQKAVEKVIAENPNIQNDTTKSYIVDFTNNVKDSILNNHYNDGKTYLTIKIYFKGGSNEYIFRYSGSEREWDRAKNSYLSIAYARDKEGNGGSEGNGGISWYTPFLKKKLVGVFESELIKKVDKELGINHKDIP